MRRRREGVFFRNKDNVEWITGDHYFALMWCKMQRHDGMGDYADFRDFQKDFFYLIYHVWSNYILGLFISKAKKTGITNLFWLYYLNRATMTKNKNYGYMNLDQNLAAKTFNDYFMYSYNGLIPALRPAFKNKSEVNGTITFGKAYRNSKKSLIVANDTEDELNSSIACVPTKPKAFDVAVMKDIAFDEPTKYLYSFAEIWRTNKEAVKIQTKYNGRAWLFNYTPENDDGSFKEAREIFYDSELRTITPINNGQTNSGLICHHIPAYASWEGAFDKYGYCDEKKAIKEITNERLKVKSDKRALQAITRQYANTKKEAWNTLGAGSTYDNIRLGDLYTDVETEEKNNPTGLYIEGNLEWVNQLWNLGLRNKRRKGELCPVRFVPLTEQDKEEGKTGKFRMYNAIPVIYQNAALTNGRDDYGILIPPERFMYALGGDPTNYAAGTEIIEGSKNCAYVMNMPDEMMDTKFRRIATKIILMEYYDRPELPDEAFEDFLMLIVYTGALTIVEANAPYVATRLMEEGLGRFMIIKDENGVMTTWKRWMGLPNEKDKKYQLIRTTSNSTYNKEVLEMMVRLIKNYIQKPNKGEKDYGSMIKSLRLISQLMDFNALDTKTSDMHMAFGYTLMAIEVYTNMLLYEENNEPIVIDAILRALAS